MQGSDSAQYVRSQTLMLQLYAMVQIKKGRMQGLLCSKGCNEYLNLPKQDSVSVEDLDPHDN